MTSRPRSRSPTISSVTRVAFSVDPSTSDNGCFDPVDVDPEGDHAGVLPEVHPIHHERHQIQRSEVRGEQLRPGRSRSGRRTAVTPPSARWRSRPARCGLRPAPARPGSAGSTGPRASAPAPSDPAPRCRRTAHRPVPAAHRSRRWRASAAARPAPGAHPGSPTRRRDRGASRSARGRGGPWARTPRSHRASMIAAITCSPVPTARASSPSRISPASSVKRHAHRVGHGGLARVDLLVLVVLAHGGPLPRGVLGGSPEYLPHGRTQVGDRHLKFHETRDNLHNDGHSCYQRLRSDPHTRDWLHRRQMPAVRPTNGST